MKRQEMAFLKKCVQSQLLLLCFLTIGVVLNMGVINKKFDPINENQTDPISLKKKMEELKDGQKGAPTPSFKFFDEENEDFQTKDPMVSEKEEIRREKETLRSVEDPLPENLEGADGENWWEESWSEEKTATDETWVDTW